MLITAVIGGVGSFFCGRYAFSLWRRPQGLTRLGGFFMALLTVFIGAASLIALVQAF